MMKAILALVFLAIVAAVVNSIGIPGILGWIINIAIVFAALYILACLFGLVSRPSWWGPAPPM